MMYQQPRPRQQKLQRRDRTEPLKVRLVQMADGKADEEVPGVLPPVNDGPGDAQPNSVPDGDPVEDDLETPRAEPLVSDFADKLIPREFKPERAELQRPETAGSVANHISALQISDDEGAAPPPPDLSRRGIYIPSRTR